MNSLEAEYSFLAPTWRLPTVATTSMYSPSHGTSYLPNGLDFGPDITLWNNTRYNSRYIPSYVPSTTARRNYPILTNQQQNYQSIPPYYQQSNNFNPNDGSDNVYNPYNDMSNYGQSHQHMPNRGLTYATNGQQNPPPPGPKRRVQIVDHHRHTPSTIGHDYTTGRQSHNSTNTQPVSRQNHTSEINRSQQNSKSSASNPYHEHLEENRHGYVGNNHNIHDYLYGLSAPDPGSYTNAFKQQQRRLQDEKLGRKSVISEYKNFVQNSGFGPAFGTMDPQNYADIERRKKIYSKSVRETNHYKLEEQKRAQNGHQRTRPVPVPKYQRAKEYAEKIEKPQHLKPVSQTELPTLLPIISPILITSLSNNSHRSSSSDLADLVSGEFNISRSRCSSSISSIHDQRRVRFHSRDFVRRRSSAISDLPSHIVGTGILYRTDSLSALYQTKKSASKLLDEKDAEEKPSSNLSFPSSLNDNEKKSIISHSMLTSKNMRFPPTASVVMNRTLKPSLLTTTSINHQRKKSTSNKERLPSQRPFTTQSIPAPSRKSSVDFQLNIKSFHHDDHSSNG